VAALSFPVHYVRFPTWCTSAWTGTALPTTRCGLFIIAGHVPVRVGSGVTLCVCVYVCAPVQALAERINFYYGNITAENTIYGITSIVQTGDVHIGGLVSVVFVVLSYAVRFDGPCMGGGVRGLQHVCLCVSPGWAKPYRHL
jgi:hypothetical protein